MKIRLRNYIALVYTLFICASVAILGFTANAFSGKLFSEYVKRTIDTEISEIVRSFADQYQPSYRRFNLDGINAIGMHYLHRGYFVSLETPNGFPLWDIQIMNMPHCNMMMREITTRMQNDYRLPGSFITTKHAIVSETGPAGNVNIEVYAPYFYTMEDAQFLRALNRFFIGTGIIFALLSVIISVCLATVVARPVVQAGNAARRISEGNFAIRIPDNYAQTELHELAGSVNDLAANLENGEKWQKRLSSDIAHELRTPLTALQGNIDAMIDGIWEPTTERLQSCNEELSRLNKLIEDLSMLSIIERDNINLNKTDFDLQKPLAQVVERFRPLAIEKGLTIKTDLAKAPIHADYDRLTQVFVNILSNAVKYTDRGNITIALNAGKQTVAPNAHTITIADTGIGIPDRDLPHIFKRFYRSDASRDRSSGGSGIGLSIAAAIINAHGGTISAESVEGAGSVFKVTLPA